MVGLPTSRVEELLPGIGGLFLCGRSLSARGDAACFAKKEADRGLYRCTLLLPYILFPREGCTAHCAGTSGTLWRYRSRGNRTVPRAGGKCCPADSP